MVSLTASNSALTILDTSKWFGFSVKRLNGPLDAAGGRPRFLLGSLPVALCDIITGPPGGDDIIRSAGSKRSGGPAVLATV